MGNLIKVLKLIIFSYSILLVLADNKIFIKLTGINCWFDTKYIVNGSCSIRAWSRSNYVVNAEASALVPIEGIIANMEIFRKTSVTYRPFLVNVTADICNLLSGSMQSYYAQFMVKWINEKSITNLLQPCPFFGYYYLRNLTTAPERLSFAPVGDYRLDLHFFWGKPAQNNLLIKLSGTGTVSFKKGRD